jgi:hypothetical protein
VGDSKLRQAAAALFAVSIIALHDSIFGALLPNRNGLLGHDYSYFLPQLLDGYFWIHNNGVLSIPWHTPAFCGGLPKFANPQALYLSVPQALTLFMDPLASVQWTFAIFSGLGFLGFHLLLRRVVGLSPAVAFFGSTLFLFNSLYSSRMLIGHLTFHSFMLLPIVAFWLIRASQAVDPGRRLGLAALAALGIAYMAVNSLPHVLFQALFAILAIGLLVRIIEPDSFTLRPFLLVFGGAGLLAVGLSAGKLVAMQAYLGHFPRTLYGLPGISSLPRLLMVVLLSVFFRTPPAMASNAVEGSEWSLAQHEFEYGVGFLPLAIMLAALILTFSPSRVTHAWRELDSERRAALVSFALLMWVPLALNFHHPTWLAVLSRIPIVSSSSSLLRWLSIYIPISILMACVLLERVSGLRRHRAALASLGTAGVVLITLATDRGHYDAQAFDPGPILAAYGEVRSGQRTPGIERIRLERNAAGEESLPKYRNAVMARGESQLLCYETVFGYRNERFPRKSLHEGSPLDASDGELNLKDPACYVYPDENGCRPGDHFSAHRIDAARSLLEYRPYDFELPLRQRAANFVSVASLGGVIVLFIGQGIRLIRARGQANG